MLTEEEKEELHYLTLKIKPHAVVCELVVMLEEFGWLGTKQYEEACKLRNDLQPEWFMIHRALELERKK